MELSEGRGAGAALPSPGRSRRWPVLGAGSWAASAARSVGPSVGREAVAAGGGSGRCGGGSAGRHLGRGLQRLRVGFWSSIAWFPSVCL